MICVCGYAREQHDALGKCPLCACGELPKTHEPYVDGRACSCACGSPPGAHDLGKATWAGEPCPGRRSKTTGKWLMLRQGSFRLPEPEPERVDWYGMRIVPAPSAEIEALGKQLALADAARPPQAVARPPRGPAEIAGAGGNKQATKAGRLARAAGWKVEALYWRGGDGAEGCALRLAREPGLRMVALWERKPGNVGTLAGWKAGSAYAWRAGHTFPAKVTHTDVVNLLGTC